MWLALALLSSPDAAAAPKAPAPAPCAAQAKALTDALPSGAGKAFVDLAACDPAAANKAAPEAFKKILAGDGGDAAIVAAIGVGSGEVVRGWIGTQEPDDRSRTISKLGTACSSPGVPQFFFDTQKALGDKFWSERWYRGLGECREPAVQDLLRARVNDPVTDRAQYNGVLEVFSHNLRKDAIPALKAAAQKEKDGEVSRFIVSAFADAASGGDPETVKTAVAAINEIAPQLPEKGVEQARVTLMTLGAEADSDHLASIRYKNELQANGGLLYGVITTEVATCKKGDTKVRVHHAPINEAGRTWPDQVAERIGPTVTGTLKLDLATSCKGTGTVDNVTPPGPFKDAAAYKAWVDGQLREIQKAHPDLKIPVVAEQPLAL